MDKDAAGRSGEPTPPGDAESGAEASQEQPVELVPGEEPVELAEADPPELSDAGESASGQTGEDRELVGVGATAVGRSGAIARSGSGPAKEVTKDKSVAKRSVEPRPPRTGPVTFVRESVGELRKVVYPTGQQLMNYFFVVLVFVLFIIAIVSLLDLAFGAAILKIFS